MKILVLVVSVLILAQCALTPEKNPPVASTPDLNKQYEIALKDKKRKKYSRAVKRFNNIIKALPNSDLADDSYIAIGDIYYGLKKYDKAYEAFMAVINAKTYSQRESYAMFMAARCLSEKGRYSEALILTERATQHDTLDKKDYLEITRLRLFLFQQLGDSLDELAILAELKDIEKDSTKLKSYKIQGENLIVNSMDLKALEKVSSRSKYGEFRNLADFQLGRYYYQKSDFSRARSYLRDSLDGLKAADQIQEANQMLLNIEARQRVAPQTIGVILPLSGKHSAVAERTLRGLQLGLGVFGPHRSSFTLAVMDSKSNPDQAAQAVERLVIEDNVVAIVGSLLSKTAQNVSAKSNELGVPNISLSQKEGLTKSGRYVFRNALTSDMIVKQLVSTAMDERGYRKFAILYPNDAYGVEYANLFWDEVMRRGGQITGAQAYKSKETDFSGPIRRLVGTYYVEDRLSEYSLHLREWKKKHKRVSSRISPPSDLLPPSVDFDALFIPDSVKALGQIAPSLPYHDISDLPLLGTNLWNNPQLISRGQGLVENAVFVDGLVSQNKDFKNTQFYSDYKRTFAMEPGILEAQAYDIGLMLRQLIASGVSSRVELASELSRVNNFKGALGKLSVSENGEFNRPLYSLTVLKGKILSENQAAIQRQEVVK